MLLAHADWFWRGNHSRPCEAAMTRIADCCKWLRKPNVINVINESNAYLTNSSSVVLPPPHLTEPAWCWLCWHHLPHSTLFGNKGGTGSRGNLCRLATHKRFLRALKRASNDSSALYGGKGQGWKRTSKNCVVPCPVTIHLKTILLQLAILRTGWCVSLTCRNTSINMKLGKIASCRSATLACSERRKQKHKIINHINQKHHFALCCQESSSNSSTFSLVVLPLFSLANVGAIKAHLAGTTTEFIRKVATKATSLAQLSIFKRSTCCLFQKNRCQGTNPGASGAESKVWRTSNLLWENAKVQEMQA